MSKIEYENLKRKLNEGVSNASLEKVKNVFKHHINSRRSLSKVRTLNDILELLEERDLLDCYNVTALAHLGRILDNQTIIDLIHLYQKTYSEYLTCSLCGEDCVFKQIENEVESSNSCEITIAFHNISKNIGWRWRALARALKVPECYIDKIEFTFPTDLYLQSLQMLLVWKELNGDIASLDSLKKALEARLCKMKGIGIHMLNPIIIIEEI